MENLRDLALDLLAREKSLDLCPKFLTKNTGTGLENLRDWTISPSFWCGTPGFPPGTRPKANWCGAQFEEAAAGPARTS